MKNTCYSLGIRLFTFIPLLTGIIFPVMLSAQNKPMKGMEAQQHNFTSFTTVPQSNTGEWRRFNAPKDYDHPEFGRLPKDAPCESCVEVLSKRTADQRYFINTNEPSEFYQQKALGDLHVLVDGDWITIDHTLEPVREGIFESSSTGEQAGFNLNDNRAYIKTGHGTVYFNNWTLFTVADGAETGHGQANWSDHTVGEDGVYVRNIFPGIDAEMIVFRGAIKTNFVLKENVYGTFDELVFRDRFDAPQTPVLQFASAIPGDGTGDLTVLAGTADVLHVGEAVLFARNGPKELVQAGTYRLNGNSVDVVVPFEWIAANIDEYELVVDPIVTGTATLAQAAITGSRYNASCNFTNSCDYTLVVPHPANATVTNVAWTFTYTANGSTCWLQDGGIRISTGACTSPSAAGFYWFCNAIGGGTCSGTNQTIFTDVSSCMPAPACTAQNITYTLRFYRSCWGASGCSNTCIGAGSPWTMTITGRTIEYANTSSPITLSSATVCAGGSITASTNGVYGVPGYSYNWSFSPSGTPSAGSGASASITFPAAGNVTLYSIVTDACGNQVTSSTAVTVTSGPAVTVNSPTICAGASATLTASGATSYTWSPAAGLSAATGSTVTANPATTTTYTVTGATGGCSATAAATVTVNPNPTITVNSPTICSGGSATLTATGATSYTWSPATGLSATTGNTVTANPPATTTYTVTGTTGGCSGTAAATVTVGSNPTVAVNSPTICSGASATLTATGATSYTWSPATGLSATTGNTVTANPAVTTTYTVTGTTGGCSGTATATVTVNPTPAITVNSAAICSGNSTTLTAAGATSYVWTPATGLSGTTGPTVTANPAATTTYTITGTTNGCSGTATSTVTVTPTPVVAVNSSTICAGASATLTATGADAYTWSPATGLSATTGATVTANPTATTTYTITGTTNSCSGTAASTVTVNPNPTVSVNSFTICSSGSANVTATGATSYTWSPPTGLSATTGATVTADPSTTTTYTVTGTTNGCSGTATSTITVNPNPTVSVNSAVMCSGSPATLTAMGAASYVWTPATGLSGTTGPTVTANPPTTTTYTVIGSTMGCTGTATATVTVNPAPVVTVSSATICAGGSATLTATGASSYTWSPATYLSATTGATVTANPPETTTYTVTGTANGCSATAVSTVTVNPNPAVSVNSATICAGASAMLTATGAATYTWSPATGLSAATGNTVTANPPATTTYTVTGTTTGCTGTSTATVTVNPLPVISASNNGPLCPGDQLDLTANGPANGAYAWTGPAAFNSSSQNPSIDPAGSANAGIYTVQVTVNGCTNIASTTLTMNSGASTAINPAGPFCADDAIVALTAVSPGGTWSGTGIVNTASGAFDPSAAQTGPNIITYDLGPGSCSEPSTVTIVVNMSPAVAFTANTLSGCGPLDVTFANTSFQQGQQATWDFGDNSNASTPASASHTYTGEGCYTVTLIVTDGTTGCANELSQANMICVVPHPDAQFTASPQQASVTNPEFQFINQSANAVSYQWLFGDGTSSSAVSPSHLYSDDPGNYEVILVATNASGCVDSATVLITVIEDLVFFIPNSFTPDGDQNNNTFQPVFTSGFDPFHFNLRIYNRWGETVFESNNAAVGWDGTYAGKLAQEGVYTWAIEFKAVQSDEKYRYAGNVTLLK
jgi:gliding motility-associated-like protein